MMAHPQKRDFVIRRNGRVHLIRRERHFSRLLAAEVCASAVVMLDAPCSKVVWRVLATHSICQFSLHFPSRASPCAIPFQLESTDPTQASISFVFALLRKPQVANYQRYSPLDIFPRCNVTQLIYFWKTALRVSGGIPTHHQEHTQLCLQYLVLVNCNG
jgi:hypothetical protein